MLFTPFPGSSQDPDPVCLCLCPSSSYKMYENLDLGRSPTSRSGWAKGLVTRGCLSK